MKCPFCETEMDMGVFSPRLTCRHCGIGYETGLEPLRMWSFRKMQLGGEWWIPVPDGVLVVVRETG